LLTVDDDDPTVPQLFLVKRLDIDESLGVERAHGGRLIKADDTVV
jgi:hypothetical protein